MDVAALSISMKQGQLMQQVGIAVMKKAMTSAETNVEALLKVLQQSVQPNLGQNVDIRL
ncbi:MAG: YjfB family protein [Acetivibrionales bacterium]|nr:putative motility protein [Clostridiaceae bacterium]